MMKQVNQLVSTMSNYLDKPCMGWGIAYCMPHGCLTSIYGSGIAELEYFELHLVPIHEHIILGTSQFWAYIAPDDAVLRSHLYLKVRNGVFYFVLPSHVDHDIDSFRFGCTEPRGGT
jgi:hypothetical protein